MTFHQSCKIKLQQYTKHHQTLSAFKGCISKCFRLILTKVLCSIISLQCQNFSPAMHSSRSCSHVLLFWSIPCFIIIWYVIIRVRILHCGNFIQLLHLAKKKKNEDHFMFIYFAISFEPFIEGQYSHSNQLILGT